MGLINLLTDPKNFRFYVGGQGYTGNGTQPSLTNIPYGKDQLGGGSSGQPYIQIPIPDNVSSLGLANNDFILRGGTLSVENAAIDALRLTKMFFDTKSPNGALFIAKQQLLSRTAVRTQTSGILNEGGYNPLGTLAQAGIINIGGHLNKQGNIFAETGAYSTNDNLYGVRITPNQSADENRLVTLYTNSTQNLSTSNFGFIKGVSINPNGRVAGDSSPLLMSYSGGPGSVLGLGQTNIRYSPTSQTFVSKNPKTNTYNNSNINSNVWLLSSKNINEQVSAVEGGGAVSSPKVGVDFRQYIRTQLSSDQKKIAASSGQLAVSPNYTTKNIEQRVKLGDPGQRQNKDYSDYSAGVGGDKFSSTGKRKSFYGLVEPPKMGQFKTGLDMINSIPLYRNSSVLVDPSVNDLVKFRIAIIDNDNPSYKTFLHFRAFLGSISDAYNAEWNGFNYLGRGEKFYNYNGFTRQISLSWTVAAQSKEELIPMYKKLNYLASSLTPDYSSTGYMRGNMAQLTVGGYIYEMPGIITGLTYEIQEDTTWEIGINPVGGSDSTVKELPHIIRVTGFNFIPIHEFRPELQTLEYRTTENNDEAIGFPLTYGSQRYISLDDGGQNNNYDNYGDTNYPPASSTPIQQPTQIVPQSRINRTSLESINVDEFGLPI